MPAINTDALLKNMLAAASAAFRAKWPGVKDYVESELKKIAADIEFIGKQTLAGKMTEKQAKLHLQLQINASKTVLLAAKGMTLLAVESAINAALGAIKDTVNTALGFVLL